MSSKLVNHQSRRMPSYQLLAARCLVLCMLLLGATAHAQQQSFPYSEGVTITSIVPFAAGGGMDVVTRLVEPFLEAELERMGNISLDIIVSNMPGAGGQIGAEAIYRAAPDGRTFGILPAGAAGQQIALGAEFDLNNFTYLAQLELVPVALSTHDGSGLTSFRDVIEVSRERSVLLGTTGYGSSGHTNWLIIQRLFQEQGIDLNIDFVHYGGTSEGMTGLLRREIDLFGTSISGAMSFVEDADELEFLVVISDERDELLPDVESFGELGLPDDIVQAAVALTVVQRLFVGPPGMAEEVTNVLAEAFEAVSRDPEFIRRFEAAGHKSVYASGEDAARYQIDTIRLYEEHLDILEGL